MSYYVIDSKRRVWATAETPKEIDRQLKDIREHIRKRRPTHAPDPNTLRVVKWNGEVEKMHKPFGEVAGVSH